MTHTFDIASAAIAAEEFDGEYVVLDVGSGRYFSLSGGTALVWQGLVDGHSVEAISAQLAETTRVQVATLVAAFVEHGLLKAAPREASAAAEPLSRALAAEGMTFEIEVFNDLADLLLSDPVHDVDEQAGWPHRPKD